MISIGPHLYRTPYPPAPSSLYKPWEDFFLCFVGYYSKSDNHIISGQAKNFILYIWTKNPVHYSLQAHFKLVYFKEEKLLHKFWSFEI